MQQCQLVNFLSLWIALIHTIRSWKGLLSEYSEGTFIETLLPSISWLLTIVMCTHDDLSFQWSRQKMLLEREDIQKGNYAIRQSVTIKDENTLVLMSFCSTVTMVKESALDSFTFTWRRTHHTGPRLNLPVDKGLLRFLLHPTESTSFSQLQLHEENTLQPCHRGHP